jgi:ribosomal-protein-alanine N-acetyltransferase
MTLEALIEDRLRLFEGFSGIDEEDAGTRTLHQEAMVGIGEQISHLTDRIEELNPSPKPTSGIWLQRQEWISEWSRSLARTCTAMSKHQEYAASARAPVLITGSDTRVLLRHPDRSDEAAYAELVRLSRELHQPWEPLAMEGAPEPDSPEAFRIWLEGNRDSRTERLLLCRRDDGALVGRFHLNEIVRGAFDSAYLSYWVGAPFASQGYMTEGFLLLLQWAFVDLRLHRLEANIQPSNRPSLALIKRAGFRREGFSPRYLKIAGQWSDHERWALTKEDWQAQMK